MYIRKYLPVNTEETWVSVLKAKERKDNPPLYGNILTEATSDWVVNMEGSLRIARSDVIEIVAGSSAS